MGAGKKEGIGDYHQLLQWESHLPIDVDRRDGQTNIGSAYQACACYRRAW
jgi:hypothetical protein